MNKEKQIMDEFEIYESLIRKNANQKYIDCQMDRVIETIKKSQKEEIVEKIEQAFNKMKDPCTCPKGGMYEKLNGSEEVCPDCLGTEWILSTELKGAKEKTINLIKEYE